MAWSTSRASKRSTTGTVDFTFNTPFTPGLYEIGQQIIIPKHIWESIDDPANETNPTPVGTGPYTEVVNFQSQAFELHKNPNYWQPDKQQIEGIQMLAFAGNDPANLATTNGETDWADQFIPDIENTFVVQGQGAPSLLVPVRRLDDQLAAEHDQGALRRR